MEQTTIHPPSDSEVGLLDYWRAVWSRRWLIVALCATAMLVGFLYSIRLPKIYVATASVLAPKEDFGGNRIGPGGNFGGLVGGGGSGVGGGGGAGSNPFSLLGGAAQSLGISFAPPSPNLNMSLALLKSRTMREQVIDHFKRTWGPRVESMIGPMKVEAGKEETIVLSIESQDPKLSAEVANFYFEQLQKVMAQRSRDRQAHEHQYYLGQIDEARRGYKAAQEEMMAFQEKNRTLAIDAGTRGAIDAAARGGGSVMALEIQRELKRMYLTDQHPEMIALSRQIYEMKKLMSHQLYGEAQPLPPEKPGAPPRKEFFVASTKMTPLYFKMVEFYRDFKTKEALYNFLAQNVETYKYTKNPKMPPVDWLDPAIPPGGPSGPNIRYNVMAAGIGSLVIGVFLALFLEYLERVKGVERMARAHAPRVGLGVTTPRVPGVPVATEASDRSVSAGSSSAVTEAQSAGRRHSLKV